MGPRKMHALAKGPLQPSIEVDKAIHNSHTTVEIPHFGRGNSTPRLGKTPAPLVVTKWRLSFPRHEETRPQSADVNVEKSTLERFVVIV